MGAYYNKRLFRVHIFLQIIPNIKSNNQNFPREFSHFQPSELMSVELSSISSLDSESVLSSPGQANRKRKRHGRGWAISTEKEKRILLLTSRKIICALYGTSRLGMTWKLTFRSVERRLLTLPFFWRLCRLKMDSKFQLRLVPELADLNNHKKTLYFVSLSSFPPRILLKMIKIFPFLSHPKESPRWSFSRRRKLCKATSEQPSPTLSSKSLPISTTLHKGWNYFWNEKFNEPTAAAIAYGLDKKGCWQT